MGFALAFGVGLEKGEMAGRQGRLSASWGLGKDGVGNENST